MCILRFAGASYVTLYVGADKVPFQVHETVLCDRSSVFRAAFNSEFKESSERTMDLPDEDPELFEHFVASLYNSKFDHTMFGLPDWDGENGFVMQTARVFVLAGKFDVESLKFDICLDLFDFVSNNSDEDDKLEPPSLPVVQFICANTNHKAPIRILLADWFTQTGLGLWPTEDGSPTDWLYSLPEFGVDLALALEHKMRGRRGQIVFEWNKSKYLERLQGLDDDR